MATMAEHALRAAIQRQPQQPARLRLRLRFLETADDPALSWTALRSCGILQEANITSYSDTSIPRICEALSQSSYFDFRRPFLP